VRFFELLRAFVDCTASQQKDKVIHARRKFISHKSFARPHQKCSFRYALQATKLYMIERELFQET